MTKKEIYNEGFDRGWSIASWQDMPEIGSTIPKHINYIGIDKIETVEDACEAFMMYCGEAESNGRDYSPFEFTAHDLNEMEEKKPYDVWEVFENGIQAGFEKNWKTRKGYYKD